MKNSYIDQQYDMLRGNVNRMCVTHDMEVLRQMTFWAYRRITHIFDTREEEIKQELRKEYVKNEASTGQHHSSNTNTDGMDHNEG